MLEMAWSVGGADGAKCYSSNPLAAGKCEICVVYTL